jgi:hypothetical protein
MSAVGLPRKNIQEMTQNPKMPLSQPFSTFGMILAQISILLVLFFSLCLTLDRDNELM